MNTQSIKRKLEQIYSTRITRQKLILLSLALIAILFLGIFINSTITANGNETERVKCYRSIRVEAGDSLWSIAGNYYDKTSDTITEYIEEIKEINGLEDENIESGNYLVISYYTMQQQSE